RTPLPPRPRSPLTIRTIRQPIQPLLSQRSQPDQQIRELVLRRPTQIPTRTQTNHMHRPHNRAPYAPQPPHPGNKPQVFRFGCTATVQNPLENGRRRRACVNAVTRITNPGGAATAGEGRRACPNAVTRVTNRVGAARNREPQVRLYRHGTKSSRERPETPGSGPMP